MQTRVQSENSAYGTWLEWRKKNQNMETPVRSEAQRVRGDHAPLLHHGCRDGPQVLEELSGLTGVQSLDVSHDPVVGLRSEGSIRSEFNVDNTCSNTSNSLMKTKRSKLRFFEHKRPAVKSSKTCS